MKIKDLKKAIFAILTGAFCAEMVMSPSLGTAALLVANFTLLVWNCAEASPVKEKEAAHV